MSYSSAEICRLFSLSQRALRYLSDQGVVHPAMPAAGPGTRARYEREQLVELAVVAAVRELWPEVPVRELARATAALRAGQSHDGILCRTDHGWYVSGEERVSDLLDGAQIAILLDVARVKRRLARQLGETQDGMLLAS